MLSFGRLEIFWPDAPVESFILGKDIVALGRSSGNDVVIDRNGVSRYHAKLMLAENQATLTDLESVNGVYIDGLRLNVEEPRLLRGGEEIQIADVRLVYYPPDIAEETVVTGLDETTQQFSTEQLLVQVAAPDFVIVPGSNASAIITLESLIDEERTYTLSIEGVPSEWLRLERKKVLLMPHEQVLILANFKPSRQSDTVPGAYPLKVHVIPEDNPENAIIVDSSLTIGIFRGYGVVMGTPKTEANEPFRLHVHNQGNGPLTLGLRGVEPKNRLNFEITPSRLTLAAGERKAVYGRIRPRSGAVFGKPRPLLYDIISRAEDTKTGFQAPILGVYTIKPLLPSWVATLLIPVVAVALVAGTALLLSLFGDTDDTSEAVQPPQIIAFSAEETSIPQGDVVSLSWQVENAEQLTLIYARPGQEPQTLVIDDTQTDAYQLQMATNGLYNISLQVVNPMGTQSMTTEVQVLPIVAQLNAEPPTLIADVLQNLDLEWWVEGAARDENGEPLITLDSPHIDLPQTEGLAERSQGTYAVRPSETVSVTLRVIGNDGVTTTRSLQLAVEAPQCVLANSSAQLYAGPDRAYPVRGLIETPQATVRPLGRNADSTWLQVEHNARGPAWVRVADFACTDFSADQLAPIADIPPPPATATPSATPTRPAPTPSPSLSPTATEATP